MHFEWMGRQEKQDVATAIHQVYIELSTACNLSCTTCVRNSIHNFAIAHFKKSLMNKIIPQLQKLSLQQVVLLGFGEALCHPDIQWHLQKLATLSVPIVLVTNGMLINELLAEIFVALPLEAVYISIDDAAGVDPPNRRGANVSIPLAVISLINEIKNKKQSHKPLVGVETVATTHNVKALTTIIDEAKKCGAQRFIVSNVFPYIEDISDSILYSVDGKHDGLKHIRKIFSKDNSVDIAGGNASVLRSCPFIEKGTIFITANGDVVPCLELAYTHTAYYFGNPRIHQKYSFGNIAERDITQIWNSYEFVRFRETFKYFEFPDCSLCVEPDMCYHRTVEHKDCYWNTSPCGECLWAKGIVLCP
ncbi:MAG: SPASM domain-containing protein [Spirochaetes bacterium]|nr:SPASM domain-containing protein [Spirochaetota bacterium]